MKIDKHILLASLLGVLIGLLLGGIFVVIPSRQKKFDGDYNRWRKLNLILYEVEQNYVDTIDRKAMTDAAVAAALQELDPHSIYMPPVELEKSETELQGNFDGIGIQFNVPNDTATVISIIPGGPSEKAGLLPGDRLISVDDRSIAGRKTPQDSMVSLMRGPAGSKVRIMVKRGSETIPFDITRGKIPVHCIDVAYMLNDTTGYIKLTKFTKTTYKEFKEATDKLSALGMKKLIFDLRDNSGGFLDQAYLLCNEFLEVGKNVVYMEGRKRSRSELDADGRGSLQNLPLVVLINEGSASSSEIFAGAIQDNDRGVLVGRRSFGKGLVQEPINFTDGSGIRLTVARFYTPSGRCIQKPYSDDYAYDIYERYAHGEMTDVDSIKVNKDEVYHTMGGRTVYGGGGIIPDVFVAMDTTKATTFYMNCTKKATPMRFASAVFDKYSSQLGSISSMPQLKNWFSSVALERQFLDYASRVDGLTVSPNEWAECQQYMMAQVYALVGRYSKLGEEAFYVLYQDLDNVLQTAISTDPVPFVPLSIAAASGPVQTL